MALQTLAYLGLIEVHHGIGTVVVDHPSRPRALILSLKRARRDELLALRRGIEIEAARRCARRYRPSSGHLQHLLIERSLHARVGPEAFVAADTEFHRGLVAAAAATLAADVLTRLLSQLHSDRLRVALAEASDDRLARLHERLLDAVDAGHEHRAAALSARIVDVEAQGLPAD